MIIRSPILPMPPSDCRQSCRQEWYCPGITGEPGSQARARDYDDIPGTYVFDGRRSRRGYPLNRFLVSLNDASAREAFRADEAAYLDRFGLDRDQREAVLSRRWLRLLEVGGNLYYTYKLAACDGMSFQDLAGEQTGMTPEAYGRMMEAGGRPIDGNRTRAEWAARASGDQADAADRGEG
jgi:protocatechuate 4,5-dioxygenase alpha subunit